eukprot:m.128207 g.128207  ORF g.128207 m.128207 type:complete len:54 (-) comp16386_c0_seq1:1639-1800(-)
MQAAKVIIVIISKHNFHTITHTHNHTQSHTNKQTNKKTNMLILVTKLWHESGG